jgi:phage shock protein PspC (stress-responsive transcriptional regulator)
MTCSRCAAENQFDSTFCRQCGAALGASSTAYRRLSRLPYQGKVAGVCAGLAAYFKVDVTVIRLLWVILSIVPGAVVGGLIAYGAAWLLMPESAAPPETVEPTRRLLRSYDDRKIAGVCGGLAAYLNVDATVVRLGVIVLSIYPGAIICGVIAYIVAWVVMPPGPPQHLEQTVAA